MIKNASVLLLFCLAPIYFLGQPPQTKLTEAAETAEVRLPSVDSTIIPEKMVTFSPVASGEDIPISPVTSIPFCDSDGRLLLDMLNPKDLNQHTLFAIADGKSSKYLPSSISDLHDVTIRGFYSSGSTVAFLVRATRQNQASQSGSKSPAGYDWSSYHEYVAKFKREGQYQGSVELAVAHDISRFALFPSGEILALGYDSLNSALRLILFNSSGEELQTLDLPTGRHSIDGGAAFGSGQGMMAAASVAGSVSFTTYKESILVWRRNSDEPILEVGKGGSTREVPLQIPKGYTFVEMVPANDWWVANFRLSGALEDAPYDRTTYRYFELRPQDASLSARLSISPDGPPYIACEAEGGYLTFKADQRNKIQVYISK